MDDLDFGATIKGFNPGQKVFNRYSLKKILGRGGMGVVWLAHDGELDRDVALKFLPEIVALDPEAVGDLKRETRRNLDLTHVNIVRIYDFVTDSRTAAISMEYIDGATLSALKLGKPSRVFTPDEIRAWLGQLCEALAFAHGKAKVVHRDLKPANLMLTKDGDLKITDFGIARGISDSVSRVSAQAGGSSGTPLYMSPQQMMGEKPAVSDDIYALGATLYELLTGKPPFYSGNVVLQVREKHPASMTERRKEHDIEGGPIPPEWETVIAACLAKNPADRPQGARELWRKLGAAQATPPPEPDRAPEAPMPASRPEISETAAGVVPSGLRRRVQALAGSAALLAGLGTGLLFCWRWAGNNQSQWWAEHWRWVEYSVLTGWIAASLALVRWRLGRDFSWRPWLGIGAAMVAVDVGFSEICDSLISHGHELSDANFVPPLMGLVLAGVALACFRRTRPVTWPRMALELWLGFACGVVAAFCANLPAPPEPIASNYVIIASYPVWVVMGSLAWLHLLRLLMDRPKPDQTGPAAKPAPRANLLAGLFLLLLALAATALMDLSGSLFS
jgi:hypothetical protein